MQGGNQRRGPGRKRHTSNRFGNSICLLGFFGKVRFVAASWNTAECSKSTTCGRKQSDKVATLGVHSFQAVPMAMDMDGPALVIIRDNYRPIQCELCDLLGH